MYFLKQISSVFMFVVCKMSLNIFQAKFAGQFISNHHLCFQVEDMSEEAVITRHDKCEHDEKKRFLSYLKLPIGYGRHRAHKRTDSRTESSGANTPDPMSPHNLDQQDSTNSPMTSPPATPLSIQVDENTTLPSISVMRKRTMSQSRFSKDKEVKEEPVMFTDIVEVRNMKYLFSFFRCLRCSINHFWLKFLLINKSMFELEELFMGDSCLHTKTYRRHV